MCNKLEKPNAWLDVIAVDLQKAFDLINHNTLVKELTDYFLIDPYFPTSFLIERNSSNT